jgi:hypothetical protein
MKWLPDGMDQRHGNEGAILVQPAQIGKMAKADRPLAEQLDELQAWLRALTPGGPDIAPGWSRVLLADINDVDRSSTQPPALASGRLLSPADFEPRWLELVGQGRRSWINLSAYGVWRDALVVVVEPPAHGAEGSYSPDQISVNFSGPPIQAGWDLASHLAIID